MVYSVAVIHVVIVVVVVVVLVVELIDINLPLLRNKAARFAVSAAAPDVWGATSVIEDSLIEIFGIFEICAEVFILLLVVTIH